MTTNINIITEEILAKINEDRVAADYEEATMEYLEQMLIDMAKAARIRREIRDGYGTESNPFYGADITGEEIANIAYWLWKNIGYTSSVQRLISEENVRAISDRTCGDVLPGGAEIQKGNKRDWVGEWTYSMDVQSIMIIEDDGVKRLAVPVTNEQLVTFARFFEIKDAQHRALSFHENYCRMSDVGRRALFPVTFTVNASDANKSMQFLSCNAEGKKVKKTWNRTLQYNSGLLNPASNLVYEAFEDMATGYVQNGEELSRSVMYKAVNFGRDEGKYAIDAIGDYLCGEKDFNGIQSLINAGVIDEDCKNRQKATFIINEYLLAWCDHSKNPNLFGKLDDNGKRRNAVTQVRLCFALGMMSAVVDSIHKDGDEITRKTMRNKIRQAMGIMGGERYADHTRLDNKYFLVDSARNSVFSCIRDLSKKLRNKRKPVEIAVKEEYFDVINVGA